MLAGCFYTHLISSSIFHISSYGHRMFPRCDAWDTFGVSGLGKSTKKPFRTADLLRTWREERQGTLASGSYRPWKMYD